MNVIPLKSFLCCMTLETGGLVISIIHLILQALILLFGIAFLTVFDCHDFQRMISEDEQRICLFERDFIAFNLLLVTFALSIALLPYWCIKAIKNRNFSDVKPLLWFVGIFAVCSMYDLLFVSLEGMSLALIKGSVNVYFFYVIYSLYIMLRDEPKRKLLAPESEPLSHTKLNV